jgi:hypothetical protein
MNALALSWLFEGEEPTVEALTDCPSPSYCRRNSSVLCSLPAVKLGPRYCIKKWLQCFLSGLVWFQKILQNFSDSPSHRIFRHMHEALNIDKK